MSNITVERRGRRSYILGNTYPHKDALRAAGAHWDGEARAWWLGSQAKAEELVTQITTAAALPRPDADGRPYATDMAIRTAIRAWTTAA